MTRCNTTAPPQRLQMEHEEWLAEAVYRFGPNANDWRFECPICHRVYSVAEFVAVGGDAQAASQECIGRANGKGFEAHRGPGPRGNADGCDYAAYGLFTSNYCVIRRTVPVPIMPFAPAGEIQQN